LKFDLDRLKARLESRGIAPATLARLISMRPETVADVLAGRRAPTEAFAVLCERALRMKPGALRPGVKFEVPDVPKEKRSWL